MLARLGRADEVVVRHLELVPEVLEVRGLAVAPLLRRHAVGLRGLRDLLAVLVHAGQELDVIAGRPTEARLDVGEQRAVRRPEVRVGVDVVDGGGDEVGRLLCHMTTPHDGMWHAGSIVLFRGARRAPPAGPSRALRGARALHRPAGRGPRRSEAPGALPCGSFREVCVASPARGPEGGHAAPCTTGKTPGPGGRLERRRPAKSHRPRENCHRADPRTPLATLSASEGAGTARARGRKGALGARRARWHCGLAPSSWP